MICKNRRNSNLENTDQYRYEIANCSPMMVVSITLYVPGYQNDPEFPS